MSKLQELEAKHRALVSKFSELTAVDASAYDASAVDAVTAEIESLEHQISNVKHAATFQAYTNNKPTESEQNEIRKHFSFVKAINELKNGGHVTGFAREMHEEGLKELAASGISAGHSNLVLPSSYINTKFFNDLSKDGTPNNASETIQKSVSASLIDVLYNNLVFADVATFFNDLRGKLSFPRFTRSATPVSSAAEKAANVDVSPTVDEVVLDAVRFPTEVPITDFLLAQSSVSVDLWVRNYLASMLAEYLETYAINQVLATSGIGDVVMGTNGGALTWPKAVELETKVKNKRAGLGALAYLTNSTVVGAAKTTPKEAGYPVYLMSETGQLNARPVRESEAVPSNLTKGTASGVCSALMFGNWNDLYIGQWGGIAIQVNPYRKSDTGVTLIEAKLFADAKVARPDSFAAIKDITTA